MGHGLQESRAPSDGDDNDEEGELPQRPVSPLERDYEHRAKRPKTTPEDAAENDRYRHVEGI
jgi:hypothetical protein